MSKNKQYKNVYTILEKAKKGELNSYYKGDGLFGKIDFFKKPDLIKPNLHYLDEGRVKGIVNAHFTSQNIEQYYKKLISYSKFKALDESKKPDFTKFMTHVMANKDKFPSHIARDIHKMFYNKIDKLEFEERTDKNQGKYKFLETANNPVGKIMSEGSNLKSSIFARNILFHYVMQLTTMEFIDEKKHQKIVKDLGDQGNDSDKGDGSGQGDVTDIIGGMLDSKFGKAQMDAAMEEAQKLCKAMDHSMPEDIQERMFEDANEYGGKEAAKLSPDYMRQIASRIENISLSMGSLKEKLKKLLDKTTSYFSGREIVIYDDLFNSDNLAGLDDFIMLHPQLRKVMVEDVQIKDVKRVGKIDIYIDVSGSMSSSCGVRNKHGDRITKIDFCKSFVAKLKEINMLNDVYLFDSRVKKYRNDIVSIAMIDCNGGTTIDSAVRSIERVGNNALVITDAEDYCNIHSDKAFFIGVDGANFSRFDPRYLQNDQCVVFDGKSIKKVDRHGKAA